MDARPVAEAEQPEPTAPGAGFVRGGVTPEMTGRARLEPVALVGWIVLAALLLACLVAAVRFDRTGRPSLVGDEATYAMQSASLAWDFDLAYSRKDYDRFVAQWGGPPDGLILTSRDGGRHLTYGKPFLYALAVAPFVRFAPLDGALVANVLFLACAAVLAARALGRRIGPAAPLWVAVFVFASVSFAYAYWVNSDLFLLAAAAAGLSLVYGGGGGEREERGADLPQVYGETVEPAEAPRRLFLRWAAAGLLLAIPGTFRPFYLVFLLPAALAAFSERGRGRRHALGGFAAGALLLLALDVSVQVASGADWSGYGGERQGFYARTGYPEVDFPAADWNRTIRTYGNTAWLQEGGIDPVWDARLWGWDAVYFLVGRNVGVLLYFLPLLLAFAAYRGDRGRWLLPVGVAIAALCFFAVRPFNFYGGGGAIGNRYFVPLYPALWFVAARPLRPWAGAALAALTAVAASLFLLPLWSHPTAFPIGEDGRYRHVSAFAHRFPYETTQSHIPGGQDVAQHGLWLKLLNHDVFRNDAGALEVVGGEPAEMLVGSPQPLTAITLEFDRQAPSRLVAYGRELRPSVLRPDGGVSFDLPLPGPRAVHPMWWTRDPYYLYQLDFHLPGAPAAPIGFRVLPEEVRAKGIVIRRSRS